VCLGTVARAAMPPQRQTLPRMHGRSIGAGVCDTNCAFGLGQRPLSKRVCIWFTASTITSGAKRRCKLL
jgi:hypothetical protein